jgi:hypothetical protein
MEVLLGVWELEKGAAEAEAFLEELADTVPCLGCLVANRFRCLVR